MLHVPRIPDRSRPRGIRRVLLTILTTAAIGASALVAATAGWSSSSTSTQSAAPVTLTFLHFAPDSFFKAVIAGFEKKYPNIKVNVQVLPFATFIPTIKSRIGNKDTSFDFYNADQSKTADLASNGDLMNLTNTSFGKAAKSAIPASILGASTYQGKIVSAPVWGSWNVLFYNKKLLKQAGIPFPSANPNKAWTYEQLFAAAKKAQAAGAKWGLDWDQPDQYYEREPLMVSAGGGTGLKGPKLTTPDVNNAGWIKGLTYYSQVFSEGLAPRGLQIGQVEPLFDSNKLAFMIGQVPIAGAAGVKGLSYGYAPLPGFAGGRAVSPSGSAAWGINPNTKHLKEVLEFINYEVLTVPGAVAGSALYGYPSLPAGAKARMAVNIKADPNVAGIQAVVNHEIANSVARPPSTKYTTFENTVNPVIDDIQNGTDVKKALDSLQSKLTALLSR